MTQRKMQSQVEEEDMLEENRPEVLRMEIESLSRNEEFARVVVSVFMARMNPTLEELDDVKTAVSEAVTNAVIHGYQGNGGIIYLDPGYGCCNTEEDQQWTEPARHAGDTV